MSDTIETTFGFDRGIQARAFNAFWFSAAPRPPINRSLVFWIFWWFAFMAVVAGGTAQEVAPWKIGVVIFFGVMGLVVYLQRTRMNRFYDEIARHWARTGEMTVRLDDAGLHVRQPGTDLRFNWSAVDAVESFPGGTVFRAGMTMIAVPDEALPGGLGGEDFRAKVADWRAG